MKLVLEIEHNLALLEEVKIEYPILQDYEDGKVNRAPISNLGLDYFIRLVDLKKSAKTHGMELFYPDKVSVDEVLEKIAELTPNTGIKNRFLKMSMGQFDFIWSDFKIHKKYTRPRNRSYCNGIIVANPIIINYLAQNEVEVAGESYVQDSYYFIKKMEKPKFYSRELKMTQDFVDNFLNFAKEKNLDIRKCNINLLASELKSKLKSLTDIEVGLKVKCVSPIENFTIDNIYSVSGCEVNYNGFVDVILTNDKGESRYVPYSSFEEVSRQRDDILSSLGI